MITGGQKRCGGKGFEVCVEEIRARKKPPLDEERGRRLLCLWCVGSDDRGCFAAEVVGPDLVVHGGVGGVTSGHGLELLSGEISTCVDGLESTISKDADA